MLRTKHVRALPAPAGPVYNLTITGARSSTSTLTAWLFVGHAHLAEFGKLLLEVLMTAAPARLALILLMVTGAKRTRRSGRLLARTAGISTRRRYRARV